MANVTPDEVRSRGQWDSADVGDALLNSATFIPAGDAWLNMKLAAAGKSFAGLGTDETALAKAAEIAYVAARVITRMPQGQFKTGLMSVKDVEGRELRALGAELKVEAEEALGLLGLDSAGAFSFDGAGDYTVDGVDETNIDLAQADEDTPFSIYP